jgi:hypothetical protein
MKSLREPLRTPAPPCRRTVNAWRNLDAVLLAQRSFSIARAESRLELIVPCHQCAAYVLAKRTPLLVIWGAAGVCLCSVGAPAGLLFWRGPRTCLRLPVALAGTITTKGGKHPTDNLYHRTMPIHPVGFGARHSESFVVEDLWYGPGDTGRLPDSEDRGSTKCPASSPAAASAPTQT